MVVQAALWWSIKGRQAATAQELRDIFASTAAPVQTTADSPQLDSVVHQGSGLINLFQAVTETVTVSPVSWHSPPSRFDWVCRRSVALY